MDPSSDLPTDITPVIRPVPPRHSSSMTTKLPIIATIPPSKKRLQSDMTPPDSPYIKASPSKRQCIHPSTKLAKAEVEDTPIYNIPPSQNDADSTTEENGEQTQSDTTSISFAKKLGNKMVQLKVGPCETIFTVHAKVLSDNVPAFHDQLRLDIIELPDQDPDVVELLIEYCYTTQLPGVGQATTAMDCLRRMRLYCLAEKNHHEILMNECVDFLMTYLSEDGPSWSLAWCTELYGLTESKSPLRRLLSKYFSYKFLKRKSSGNWKTDLFSSVAFTNPDIIRDIFTHVRPCSGGRRLRNPKDDPPSEYYVGTEGTFKANEPEFDRPGEFSDQDDETGMDLEDNLL